MKDFAEIRKRRMIEKLRIGVIANTHGIKGEAKVFPTGDDPKRFSALKEVYLKKDGKEIRIGLSSVRYFKNLVICKFEGIDTPEALFPYKNADIYMDRKDADPLKENENYIADLIGLEVITDEGRKLGRVEDIWPTGANQVMEVKPPEGKHILIPYIKECILEVEVEGGFIKVHLLEGLLDL